MIPEPAAKQSSSIGRTPLVCMKSNFWYNTYKKLIFSRPSDTDIIIPVCFPEENKIKNTGDETSLKSSAGPQTQIWTADLRFFGIDSDFEEAFVILTA